MAEVEFLKAHPELHPLEGLPLNQIGLSMELNQLVRKLQSATFVE